MSLEALLDYIPRMARKWEFLAIKLGMTTLKDNLNEKREREADSKCLEIIHSWIDSGQNVTWDALVAALRSPAVNLGALADEIQFDLTSKP